MVARVAARKVRLGISSCLLGERVRYDGGEKRHPLLLEALGPLVEWVPVCPEVELGLGVPREPIQLVGSPESPRLVGVRSGADHTEAMRRYAERRVEALAALGLDGWVTKDRSPSCGLRGVPVAAVRGGPPAAEGTGLFLRALRARLPDLPIADERQLEDEGFRSRFLAACLGCRAAPATRPGG
jgi:uncharacterized protein YbbK (DUF523 family)